MHDPLINKVWIYFSSELAGVVVVADFVLHALSPGEVLLLDEPAVVHHLKLPFVSPSRDLSLLELGHARLLLELRQLLLVFISSWTDASGGTAYIRID